MRGREISLEHVIATGPICDNATVPSTITFTSRHCGPPMSANGGYASGSLAAFVDGDAEVTLRLPPALDEPLSVHLESGSATLLRGESVVAVARSTTVEVEVPHPVSFAAAVEAAESSPFYDLDWHPFPGCFTCGPLRDAGDGLRIFPGAVSGSDVFAAPWQPHSVDRPTIWAALDCPSAAPVLGDGSHVFVLGTMAARIDEFPVVGDDHVVMSWSLGGEGRKQHSASALYDRHGRCIGRARATWIALSRPA